MGTLLTSIESINIGGRIIMDEIFVDDEGIKYLVDEDGEMHFIEVI